MSNLLKRVNNELTIPTHVQKRLSEHPPAGKGSGRHDDIKWITGQLSAQGFDEESIFQICRDRYIDQPDKDDKEIRRLISGAAKLGYKPVSGRSTARVILGHPVSAAISRVKPYEHDGSKEEIPADSIDLKYSEFFKSVLGFKDNEFVWLGWSEYRDFEREDVYGNPIEPKFIQGDIGLTVSDIAARLDGRSGKGISGDVSSFFSVNPHKTGNGKRVPENLSRFLYTMVESDTLLREEQIAIYKKSGLPIKCLLDSGGDSIHAIIKVDAENLEEYKDRVAKIHEFLGGKASGFDATQDPVRFSRLPNSMRTEKGPTARQRLIATDIGASSFEGWEERQPMDDGLPEDSDLVDILESEIEEPKHLLINFVRWGQFFLLSGGSKTRKSWTAMELAISVSQGGSFLKWEANEAKVYYVDTELEPYDFKKRMELIAKAKGYENKIEPDEIRSLLLWGEIIDIKKLVESLIRKLKGKGYGLIVIDSLYSLLDGVEENSNDHVREVCNLLRRLAKETGACVMVSLHHAKGDMSTKRALDRIVGGGTWGRACDIALDIIKHGSEKDAFNFEPTLRTFEGDNRFVAKYENHSWKLRDDIKPDSGKSKIDADITEMLDLLSIKLGGYASSKEWRELVCSEMGLKDKEFRTRKERIEKSELARTEGKTSKAMIRLTSAKDPDSKKYKPSGIVGAKLRNSALTIDTKGEDRAEDEQENDVNPF
jgi:RecA-family ATPase